MKKIVLIFIAFTSSDLFAKSTYQDLIMTNDNAITKNTKLSCLQKLRDHISSKKNFKTTNIVKYLTRISDLSPKSQSDIYRFYHYTNSEKMITIAQTKDFDSLFLSLRQPDQIAPMDWNLYLAGDDQSSKEFGTIKTRFTIDPSSFVIDMLYYFDGNDFMAKTVSRIKVIEDLEHSIIQIYPELEECKTEFPKFGKLSYPENVGLLTQLILLDSNVSLIAYYGLKNTSKKLDIMTPTGLAPFGEPVYWYELIDARYITDMEIISK